MKPLVDKIIRGLAWSLLFALFLYAVDVALQHTEYVRRLTYLHFRSGNLKIIVVYILAILLSTFFIYGISRIPKIGTYVAGLLIGVAFAINIGFFISTGKPFDISDVRIVLACDARDYRDSVLAYLSLKMVGAVLCGAALGVLFHRFARRRIPSLPWVPSLGILGLVLAFHWTSWNFLYFKLQNFPIESTANMLRSAFYLEKENREFFNLERHTLDPLPKAPGKPENNIVLIIDESVRFDYITINRPDTLTTPYLKAIADTFPGFHNLGLTIASSTCSFTTKALIITGVTILPDKEKLTLTKPTLFDYAKLYGYRTIIIDVPGSNFPNIVFRKNDMKMVDTCIAGDELTDNDVMRDVEAAVLIRRITTSSTGNFILLVKKGAHFHYENSYPRNEPQYSRFQPRLSTMESYGASREKTINSYKNALSFSVDSFAAALLSAPLHKTTIIWTSDHGQSLQEHGQTYTHCNCDIEEALVPLMIISDHPWETNLPKAPDAPTQIIPSHHTLFPTIVSLMSNDSLFANQGYRSLFSRSMVRHPMYYLYGGLWSQTRIEDVNEGELAPFMIK